MKYVKTLAVVTTLAIAAGTATHAQEKAPAVVTPLKMQIVISRYQGEKKISSMPFTLSVNAGSGRANLRMGTRIPVVMVSPVVVDGQKMPTAGPIQYQDVGTNIDCAAMMLDDGRFRVEISVDDTSVYPDDQAKSGGASSGNPSFRSFKAAESMVLKEGQTTQFTTATDKVTGEVVKVDVTLTVVR
jgi:hypothetical protein